MPRWRLAEAVVIIEFLGCLRIDEANEILAAEGGDERRKRLAQMQLSTLEHCGGFLTALEEREDIKEFLAPFRQALRLRLKEDKDLSDRDRRHYKLWEVWLSRFAPPVEQQEKRSKPRRRK